LDIVIEGQFTEPLYFGLLPSIFCTFITG